MITDDPCGRWRALTYIKMHEWFSVGDADSWAVFSQCEKYRYMLGRRWDYQAPCLSVGMLNPSTADHQEDDPTIRRVIGFAKRDGFGAIIVWNCGAYRSTSPRDWLSQNDPMGKDNGIAISIACGEPGTKVVAACGAPRNRKAAAIMRHAMNEAAVVRPLWKLGALTKEGWPRHPLYLRSDSPITRLHRVP